MMNRTWLARREEAAIEPDLDIVDPHHHLWDYESLYGAYDLDDLHRDTASGHRVGQTVFIDCGSNYATEGPDHLRPVGETRFVAERADRSDRSGGARIAAIVGHADLSAGAAVREVLEAHLEAAGGRFRGIRHSAARYDDPSIPVLRAQPPEGLYADRGFRRGASVLAEMGLSFEAWQYHTQLSELTQLARAVPDLAIVVNHLGGPLGVGRYAGRRDEVFADLRSGLAGLAELPNIFIKLGGIGMTRYGGGWHDQPDPPSSDELGAMWGDLLRWCIDVFGPDRAMFESNFPVDGESCSYTVLWNTFKKVSSGYDEAERAALFSGTARRFYRLVPT
jgi:predicted TIM-barrel fold metal-dependent hydrolase